MQSLAGWLNGLQVDLAAQQATVNDHSQSITELREAFNQLILQGNALVFASTTPTLRRRGPLG